MPEKDIKVMGHFSKTYLYVTEKCKKKKKKKKKRKKTHTKKIISTFLFSGKKTPLKFKTNTPKSINW